MRKAHVLVFFALLLFVAQTVFYYFKATDENSFNVSLAVTGGCFFVFMTVLSFLARLWIRFIYSIGKKRPNKSARYDYWFAPERKEQVVAYCENMVIVAVTAAMLFVLMIFEIILNENLPTNAIFIALAIYMIFDFFIIGITVVKFFRIPKAVK